MVVPTGSFADGVQLVCGDPLTCHWPEVKEVAEKATMTSAVALVELPTAVILAMPGPAHLAPDIRGEEGRSAGCQRASCTDGTARQREGRRRPEADLVEGERYEGAAASDHSA